MKVLLLAGLMFAVSSVSAQKALDPSNPYAVSVHVRAVRREPLTPRDVTLNDLPRSLEGRSTETGWEVHLEGWFNSQKDLAPRNLEIWLGTERGKVSKIKWERAKPTLVGKVPLNGLKGKIIIWAGTGGKVQPAGYIVFASTREEAERLSTGGKPIAVAYSED